MEEGYQLAPGDRFIRASEFYFRLGVSKPMFYKCIKLGTIPKPIKLSERCSVWPLSLVNDVLQKVASGELKLSAART